jgi:hypothetical protein
VQKMCSNEAQEDLLSCTKSTTIIIIYSFFLVQKKKKFFKIKIPIFKPSYDFSF